MILLCKAHFSVYLRDGSVKFIYLPKSSKYRHVFEYRKDPVPGTKCYKSSGWMFRSIRTYQEMKLTYACDSKFIRKARNTRNLPNSWEDKVPSSIYDKCWKRFGKKRKSWDKFRKNQLAMETITDYLD